MKVCPVCFGLLWRRDEPTAEQAALLAAQRLQVKAERERKRQEQREERRATFHVGKERRDD